MSTAACTTTSPWLRLTPNGLRASKGSRSVLHGATPMLSAIDEGNAGSSRCGFDEQRISTADLSVPTDDVWPLTPTTPPPNRRPAHPFADVQHNSSDDEYSEGELGYPQVIIIGGANTRSPPMSPLSFRSRETSNTSATEDTTVHILRARAQRINTARARSHSINEIRQLLSPPPDSSQHLLPPWSPLKIKHSSATDNTVSRPSRNELEGLSATLSSATPAPQFSHRSLSPVSPAAPSSSARSRAIAKNMSALLEHINQDESDHHLRLNSAVRTSKDVSLPGIARQHSDSSLNAVSLPPPPRPRNRALVRMASAAVQTHSLPGTPVNLPSIPIQSPETRSNPALVLQPPPRRSSLPDNQELSPTPPPKDPRPVPTLSIPPPPALRDSLERQRLSLYSIPLTPVGIPLPPSTATCNFPQSPHSTVFHSIVSPRTTPQRISFLPSCRATSVHSSAIIDCPSPRPSEDRTDRSSNRLSTLSNPFGDFTFLRPFANNRASGISFASNVSGSSARSPTEAESIPIALHRGTSQDAEGDEFLLPSTPRSSLLRSGFEVDVHLPRADEDDEDDESVTEEFSRKSTEKDSILGRQGCAKSLTLPYIPIASLNKAARVLGISGDVHHVPLVSSPSPMSSSPENGTPTSQTDPSQHSFLPSTAPSERVFNEQPGQTTEQKVVPFVRASSFRRCSAFIGRTPSPAGRTRELDSEDEAPSPPPILTFPKPIHGRKHSSSDPSVGIGPIGLTGRPSTLNMRTRAERAELLKKTRKIQQVLGDVPPVSGTTGSTFYRVTRAARSEDSLVTPTSARGDVVVIGGAPVESRHRPTASLSSRPLLALSPALQTDGCLDIKTPGAGDEFGLGLTDGGLSPVSPLATRPDVEDIDGEGPENEQDEVDEAALARRAKRAKVAKLNRYLGSRVPAHLVLGLEDWDYEQGLPEARSEDEEGGSIFSGRKKRRASDGDYALLEDGMNDLSVMSNEEKARAVRRKAKMEKMFGERPPQRLYQVPTGADTPSRSEMDDESEPEGDHGAEHLDGREGGEHYQSYRASFNSLAYFVKNADRDSLEGLYDIVRGPSDDSEAQRSQFAARRKRAAKLSNFFRCELSRFVWCRVGHSRERCKGGQGGGKFECSRDARFIEKVEEFEGQGAEYTWLVGEEGIMSGRDGDAGFILFCIVCCGEC
ncbi:hypothetical protein OPQ81_008792 [Rhizoctonia solani]|nr:hypothetical protein OPQ81_008792 [Rhizoctonia solani]